MEATRGLEILHHYGVRVITCQARNLATADTRLVNALNIAAQHKSSPQMKDPHEDRRIFVAPPILDGFTST